MRNKKKIFSFISLRTFLILSLVFATVANMAFAPIVAQAKPVGEMSPSEQAKSWLYFNAMAECVQSAGTTGSFLRNEMSVEGVNNGKWFNSGRAFPAIGFTVGYMGVSVNGFPKEDSSARVECGGSNIKWINDAFRLWGYSNNVEAWCALTGNLKRTDGSICTGSSSSAGWDTTQATQALRSNFERVLKQKVYNGAEPSRSNAARYAHAQAAFFGGCLRDKNPSPYTGGESGDTVYRNVTVVSPTDGSVSKVNYAGVKKQSDSILYSVSPAGNNISDTCAGLVAQMNTYAAAYSKDVQARIADGQTGDTGVTCAGEEECEDDATTTCAVEGVGWIICPITNFMAGISDGAFSAISSFLTVDTALYSNTDSSSGTYAAWSAFRNIANIAFAILFIFIIYSQLTGMGVSNYGIKKTLPRLVIAAILVNLSFFVCQLAVDVTQILGGAINGFLQNVPVNGANSTISTWEEILGPVLAGTLVLGGVAVGAAVLALSISLPLLLAFLAAVVMTVVILVGREAAIVILIVLSPLAFVAYLLPNTEKWFKRWYKMFGALLMVYPIIALLYGGGALASKIIANAGSTSGDDMTGFALGLTAIAVSAVPLLMTPTLLKNALSSTGSIGGKLSGIASKANSRIRSTANNSRLGEARQGLKNEFALRRASSRANGKGLNKIGKAIDDSRFGKAVGLDKGAARAVGTVLKEDEQEVEAAAAKLKLTDGVSNPVTRLDVLESTMKDAISKGDDTKARAAQRILLNSGSAGIGKVQAVYSDEKVQKQLMTTDKEGKPADAGIAKELRTDINAAGLKGKNNALATYGYQGSADSFNTHANNASTYSGLTPVELAGQASGNIEHAEHLVGADGKPAISASMASAVLNNASASALLDGKKRAVFERVAAGGGTATGTGTATTGGTNAGTGTSTGGGTATGATTATGPATQAAPPSGGNPTILNVPHAPSAPQSQAAPQASSPAASAPSTQDPRTVAPTNVVPSSGGVFSVSHSGTTTPPPSAAQPPAPSRRTSPPPTPPTPPNGPRNP